VSGAPVQLRVVIRGDGNGNDIRTLEMRHSFAVDASGGFCPGRWTEWEEVPEFDFLSAYEADEEERTEQRLNDLYGA
jgi:hypothetical protein